MRRLSRRSGFSLVELLTVIAIIAILAAIIFPVMGMVKERARQTGCMTNIKQIGMGLNMFKTDNRRYPVALVPAVSGANFPAAKSDAGLMGEYVKGGAAVFHCPSSKVTNTSITLEQNVGVASGATPIRVYQYNSYEGWTNYAGTLLEQHYCIDWWKGAAGVPQGGMDSTYTADGNTDVVDYKRQLKFRNPPDDTVVTWCSNHETREFGTNGNVTSVRGKSIVLFLSGECLQMDAAKVYKSRWRIKPLQ